MKILIIRFSSIGDIVLTTPVIRCVKTQLPDAELHYVTKSSFAPVLKANPYIDKIHVLGHSWETLFHELEAEDYDYIIDLHRNIRSIRLRSALKKKGKAFKKLNTRKWIYVNTKINVMPEKHIVQRYLEAAYELGVKDDGKGLDYFIPENEHVKDRDIPLSHHPGYIGIVVGAAHNTKKLPVHKLKELCLQLAHPIIILGGKEDSDVGKELAAVDPVKIYNACGKFSINESADLVRRAKIIVTHDTGLMHIAAAFNKPVISVWGNTVPSFGMYPYFGIDSASPAEWIQVKKLWCRPCSKIGYAKCPLGHFKCMNKQDMSRVVAMIQRKLVM